MKTLNLDQLAPPKRSVTLDGAEHPVRHLDVEDFIYAQTEGDKIEKESKDSPAQFVISAVDFINRMIPTLAKERLRKLSVAQLLVLVQFVNGAMDEEAEQGAAQVSSDTPKPEGDSPN